MSGNAAPKKQGEEIKRVTMDGKRSFDSYIAKAKAEKELKDNPGLRSELQGQNAGASASSRKPKKKKSHVRGLDPMLVNMLTSPSAQCLSQSFERNSERKPCKRGCSPCHNSIC